MYQLKKSAAYKKTVAGTAIDYILAPTKVNLADVAQKMGTTDALTPDDGITDITILDVLLTAYDTDAAVSEFTYGYNSLYASYYVSAIKDTGTQNYITNASDYIYGDNVAGLNISYTTTYQGISTSGMLTEHDLMTSVSTLDSQYKGGSGWVISQNNAGPYYGVSTRVTAGDTLRMEWTNFNGMDIGYTGYFYNPEDTDNWGWTPGEPFAARVNKDALVEKLAEINHECELSDMSDEQKTAYDNANAALKSITKTSVASELAALISEF